MPHPILESLDDRTLTVTEYLDLVNELLGPLRVSVEGEVTDLKILPQWTFFSLKDEESGALLRCGLHSGMYRRIGVNLDEGMTVKVEGYGKISPKSGNFGFWVSHIEPVGEGALRRAYELLVEKLKAEGLFTRKRALPAFIHRIGVISSRNGVVTQDLRNNLAPLGFHIDFVHSGVEGADAAPELLRAIEHFSQTREQPDVLVLIRGGGSLESLQGFNNEAVCRALFAAPVPVIVGIGHDIDAPIATMVADWSASTPTAVAHVINSSWSPITERLPALTERLLGRFRTRLHMVDRRVPLLVRTQHELFTKRLHAIEHRHILALRTVQHAIDSLLGAFTRYEQTIAFALRRIPSLLTKACDTGSRALARSTAILERRILETHRQIGVHARILEASDPQRLLQRGFGLTYDQNHKLVRSVADVTKGDTISTRLADGSITSVVQQ